MFTTRIRTGLGEELTVPNSFALGVVSKNYSRTVKGVGFVLDTTVTIGYDAPWRQVQAMLVEAARRTPGVLSDPAPRVFQTALSDFYVEYRLVMPRRSGRGESCRRAARAPATAESAVRHPGARRPSTRRIRPNACEAPWKP